VKITFVCQCGKRLRAREELARRRIMCPRCGSPVGVPSREQHSDGRAGPMSPEEIARRRRGKVDPEGPEVVAAAAELGPINVRMRRRRHNLNLEGDPLWKPLDGPLVCKTDAQGRPQRSKRLQWELETRWSQCLLYPLRALGPVAGLSLLLAVLTFVTVGLLPHLAEFQSDSAQGWLPLVVLVVPVLILGYTASFLDMIVTGALAGGAQEVGWPGLNMSLVVGGALKWLLCFLAGPVLPAAGALWYWFGCGDPLLLDNLILAEFLVASLAWWLLAILSVNEAHSLAGLAPWRVGALVHRMGWRVLPALIAPAAVLLLGWLAATAVEETHHEALAAFFMLVIVWFAILVVGTFLLRLLGVWCKRSC
jgi:hypothetical protein